MSEPLIRTLADVEAFEQVPLEHRADTWTIPEVVAHGAGLNPDAVALYYLLDADPEEIPLAITYAEFMGKMRQTANLLRRVFGGTGGGGGGLLPGGPGHYPLLV